MSVIATTIDRTLVRVVIERDAVGVVPEEDADVVDVR
jgi:hypothetical protein